MSTPSLNKNKQHISGMFNDIATHYDTLNHLLSFQQDKVWRKKLAASVAMANPQTLLDVATGTGDVAIQIANTLNCQITGVDIAEEMLEIAQKKAHQAGLSHRIKFMQADATELPFEEASFDCVTVAFGIRNFENLEKGLCDLQRVLKPGGKLCILEFSHPKPPFRWVYTAYSLTILPLAGWIFSGNSKAYSYLRESSASFPNRSHVTDILKECGFKQPHFTALTLGTVCLYESYK